MGGEWIDVTLGGISTDVSYGYTESATHEKIGPHFLRITDIQNGVVDWNNVPYCPIEPLKLPNYLLERGDIVVARTGNSTGENYIFSGTSDTVYASYLIRFKIDHTKADPFFVWYNMRSPAWWSFISGAKTGSAQAGANAKVLGLFPFKLPHLDHQKSIAHILGTFDEKIELNRQMNTTLESMAQALFKSWFVDFDPVIDNALAAGNPIPEPFQARAKTRKALGDKRKPLPEAIQQQFPSSFVFTEEMGWIPGGWSFARFLEAAHVVMGQSPAGDTYNSDGKGTPLVNGPVEFAEYFVRKSKWTTAPSKCCNVGDLIVCVRGSTTGRYVKADGEYCLGRGVCAIQGKISQVFADQTYKANIDLLLLMTTGSTFPNWSGPTLNNFPIVLPPNHMLRLFEDQAGRITRKIGSNCIQNDMLSQLRDTLLPKLLSGQLRIPDAEKLMADAL